VEHSFRNFFFGAFTYHWHNQWKAKEIKESYAGQFNKEIDDILKTNYNIKIHPSFIY